MFFVFRLTSELQLGIKIYALSMPGMLSTNSNHCVKHNLNIKWPFRHFFKFKKLLYWEICQKIRKLNIWKVSNVIYVHCVSKWFCMVSDWLWRSTRSRHRRLPWCWKRSSSTPGWGWSWGQLKIKIKIKFSNF